VGMAGRNRRLAWMMPAVLGIVMQGGCQLGGRHGPSSTAARPDGGPAGSSDVAANAGPDLPQPNGKGPDGAPVPDGPELAANRRGGDPAITPNPSMARSPHWRQTWRRDSILRQASIQTRHGKTKTQQLPVAPEAVAR
jgi:hypothetical protein